MNIEIISDAYTIADRIKNYYDIANKYKVNHIVFLNTCNPQSTLNAKRFAVNFLKSDSKGNEEVVFTDSNLIEVPDINIIYKGITIFKNNNKYDNNIDIGVWTDHSGCNVYW